MKNNLLVTLLVGFTTQAFAQLYAPGAVQSSPNSNVGIGTSSPLSKLSVIGETTDNSIIDLLMVGEYRPSSITPENGNGVGISFAFADNYNAPKVRGSIRLVNHYYNQRSSMIFRTANNDQSYDRMVIDGNGFVGIGTDLPNSYLEVKNPNLSVGQVQTVANFTFGGWNHFENDGNQSTEGRIVLGSSAFTNGVIKRAEIGFATSGNWQTGGRLNFYTTPDDQNWTPVKRMTIDHVGNVGIGITNPTAKLEVDGNIISEEIKVQVVNGPDYVFSPDYELRSLEETKTYIQENQHLPEIPSAKEMEANGVALGEMNMMLLKKIEELTLYILEQNQKIESMQKDIENLTKAK